MAKDLTNFIIRAYHMDDTGKFISEEIERYQDRQENVLNMVDFILKKYRSRSKHIFDERPENLKPEAYLDVASFDGIVNLAHHAHLTKAGEIDKRYGKGSLIIIVDISTETLQLLKIELSNQPVFEEGTYRQIETAYDINDQYFKYAHITKNEEVEVIDRQQTDAKFWTEKFLSVKRSATSEQITNKLIEDFNSGSILNDSLSKEKIVKIKDSFEQYLLDKQRNRFSIQKFITHLEDLNIIDENEEIFKNYGDIDDNFEIDKKVAKQKFKLDVLLDKDSNLKLTAYSKAKAKGLIEVNDDNGVTTVTITVPTGVNIDELR